MPIKLDVQIATQNENIPTEKDFQTWASTIDCQHENMTTCLRIVNEDEARQLNKRFRDIDKATNVLSFPTDIPSEHEINFLGDVVICASIVEKEAKAQNKKIDAHWAHLLIHGLLHLQGYLHDTQEQAEIMESLEIEILSKLGIKNPYQII